MRNRVFYRLLVRCFSITAFIASVTGCSVQPSLSDAAGPAAVSIAGAVHGGQQPVAGATIQLYTVGTTADGSASTPLLTSTVVSAADGTFSITGLYSCSAATLVYITATGGNPGVGANNPNLALMTALGPAPRSHRRPSFRSMSLRPWPPSMRSPRI